MYTQQQASQLRQQFWTAFGQYMLPVPSADGEKINWVNYKTGVKDIHFRLQATTESATIAIEITHKDLEIQELYFDQFKQLKTLLQNALAEDWQWQLHVQDDAGHIISRISTNFPGINILHQSHWPQLISFFKPRIIALDDFWSTARYTFEAL